MRLLVFPRNEGPYQTLLYSEMQRRGVQVSYLGEATRSQTLSILLLPFETAFWRLRGARFIHIHWVYVFMLPGASKVPVLRRVAQAWFLLWLRVCRSLAMRIVWTAHNVLPHVQVFADDVRARRALVKASALVVAHSPSALDELKALGAVPGKAVIMQHGPIEPTRPAGTLRMPGSDKGLRRFLFLGRIMEYKGVQDLLESFVALPSDLNAQLLIAGQCFDPELEDRLRRLAAMGEGKVQLRLEYVPDEEITPLLSAADVVVLPYRQITTSGSVMLALAHGRPLIVPSLSGLAQLPDDAVVRYHETDKGLAEAILGLTEADSETLQAMSAAAFKYAGSITWQEMADTMMAEISSMLHQGRPGNVNARTVKAE